MEELISLVNMFLEQIGCNICDTCEQGCAINGHIDCVEYCDIKNCVILREKQFDIMNIFIAMLKGINNKYVIKDFNVLIEQLAFIFEQEVDIKNYKQVE